MSFNNSKLNIKGFNFHQNYKVGDKVWYIPDFDLISDSREYKLHEITYIRSGVIFLKEELSLSEECFILKDSMVFQLGLIEPITFDISMYDFLKDYEPSDFVSNSGKVKFIKSKKDGEKEN